MTKKIVALIIIIAFTINLDTFFIAKKRYDAEFLVLFDTVSKIISYSDSKEEFSKQSHLIYDELDEYHKLYNIYDDFEGVNNIKTINDNAGIAPVKVDKRIIDLLLFAKKMYKLTNGKVNVAFGSVLKIWHDYREYGIDNPQKASLPPFDELKEASLHTDINRIIINNDESTVYLDDAKMRLDVGAIPKGYATQRVSEIARQNEFSSGVISIGGNVCAIGNKGINNNQLWNVGVQNPNKESENSNLFIVYLDNMSLVTSGDYERYFTVNIKRYHHIINPDTLYPARYFSSITIINNNSGVADALSTAIFNMPFEEGFKLIESLPKTEAVWVFSNGDIKTSSNFSSYIKDKGMLIND